MTYVSDRYKIFKQKFAQALNEFVRFDLQLSPFTNF